MKKGAIVAIIFAFMLAVAPVLHADLFELSTAYSGPSPAGSTPWLTAEFVQDGTDPVPGFPSLNNNIVILTMNAPGLAVGQYVDAWYFYTTAQIGPNNFALQESLSTATKAEITTGTIGSGPAAGFNIEFKFDIGFTGGKTAVYYIEDLNLTVDQFNVPVGSYYSVAQVGGIANNGIGWIAATAVGPSPGPSPVPEPATMLLLGAGLIGLGFFGRKRFLK
jgi:hypothetical protein